ncbi:caspase-6 [Protopterus annectens]|uniref:caspase-6 n=1 Tax=Protopterus annectens TaxID=7888 RepID=UPI001CFBB814|nr:caspase-6 [Protopterus annectens]
MVLKIEHSGNWFSFSDAFLADSQENLTETDHYFVRSPPMDPNEEYNMKHKRRGIALIFNHEYFFWHLAMSVRQGTNADKENLYRRLKELGFEVKAFDNLKATEMWEKMHEVAEADHHDADCFLCVFLSHGENEHIYAYDAKIRIQELTDLFKGDKCKSLAGKPKLFIIQACRGEKHDEPVVPMDVVDAAKEQIVNEDVVDAAAVCSIPAGADFLMCYSVAEGYYSHRETLNGSWFVQDFCDLLRTHGSSLEITELLTLVNRKVSNRTVAASKDPNVIGKKQAPCFASMLTKKMYFRPKTS